MSTVSSTPAQVALALVVVRSRPPNLSISEYLDEIRSAIVHKHQRTNFNTDQYIDSALFWKQAYEKSELEKAALRDKLFDLEEESRQYSMGASTIKTISKRSLETQSTTKANTQTKRRKTESKVADQISHCTSEQDLKSFTDQRRMLRALFSIRSRLKHKASDTKALHYDIKAACKISRKCLEGLSDALSMSKVPITPKNGINATLAVIYQMWTSLLEALNSMKSTEPSLCGDSISEIVLLFQASLGLIQQFCLDEADHRVKLKKRKTKGGMAPMAASIRQECCLQVSKTMCSMIDASNLNSDMDCSVFEGVFVALLDHLGSSMSLLIFTDPDAREPNGVGVTAPRGLIDVAHIDDETALATCKLAGPFLTPILERAMSLVRSMTDAQRSRLLRLPATTPNRQDSLAGYMMKRLQNTLLRGVYGDDDNTFQDALKRSAEPSEADLERLHKHTEPDQGTSDWFVGQVWEHLGWDILIDSEMSEIQSFVQ